MIDFSKSFCKYYDIVFYQLHHTESLNFNIKQSLRDINRKKQVKGDKDNVFEFLVSAFQGMIPFSKKVKTDIEELETEELKSYKAPTLSIEQLILLTCGTRLDSLTLTRQHASLRRTLRRTLFTGCALPSARDR